jgi:hypothetical protein
LSTVPGKVVLAFLFMHLLGVLGARPAWLNLLTGPNVPNFAIDLSGRRFKKARPPLKSSASGMVLMMG